MEAFGQQYGYVLYEHTMTEVVSGKVQPGDRARDRARDRAILYINDERKGIIDSQYQKYLNVSV